MIRNIVVLCLVAVAVAGCGEKKDDPAAAAGTQAPAGQAAAQGGDAKPAAAPAGSLVKGKVVKDECTFEFSAPEALKPKTSDGVSVTVAGDSFELTGYAGSDLKSEKNFVSYVTSISGTPPVASGLDDGVQYAVTLNKSPSEPVYAVYGQGGEVYGRRKSSSSLGCSFACTGKKEREADVIAMCKSVKITVDESKIPE